MRLKRTIEFAVGEDGRSRMRVIDLIHLSDPRLQVFRMSFGVDHQSAYVAATGVYQDSVLQDWIQLDEYIPRLNAERQVSIVREF